MKQYNVIIFIIDIVKDFELLKLCIKLIESLATQALMDKTMYSFKQS